MDDPRQDGARGAPADPSRWRARLPVAILAAAGLAISLYLAAFQLGLVAAPWDPLFGAGSSARVLRSGLARALPIPDAAIGAFAYAVELALDLALGPGRWRAHPRVPIALGVVAAGLGLVGVALVLVQVAVVRAGCALCLCSAAASIAAAALVLDGDELHAALRVAWARHQERTTPS